MAHFRRGEIHLFESQISEAAVDFQQELAPNPAHAATYHKLGDADSRIHKFDDAEKLLQRRNLAGPDLDWSLHAHDDRDPSALRFARKIASTGCRWVPTVHECPPSAYFHMCGK